MSTELHLFYARHDGSCQLVGRWLPPNPTAGLCAFTTGPDGADLWAEQLRLGVLPHLGDVPADRRAPSAGPLPAGLP